MWRLVYWRHLLQGGVYWNKIAYIYTTVYMYICIGRFSQNPLLHFAIFSCPGWQKCDQVYEDASTADRTQVYQILQQSLDGYKKNK